MAVPPTVRAEEKKDKALAAKVAGAPNAGTAETKRAEKAVASASKRSIGREAGARARWISPAAMKAFRRLRAPIDAFFDKSQSMSRISPICA